MSLILITVLPIIYRMHRTYCKLIVYENTICGDKNKSTTNLWTKQCRLLRHNVSSRFSYLYLRLGMWFKQVETKIITHYYLVVIFCVIQKLVADYIDCCHMFLYVLWFPMINICGIILENLKNIVIYIYLVLIYFVSIYFSNIQM